MTRREARRAAREMAALLRRLPVTTPEAETAAEAMEVYIACLRAYGRGARISQGAMAFAAAASSTTAKLAHASMRAQLVADAGWTKEEIVSLLKTGKLPDKPDPGLN